MATTENFTLTSGKEIQVTIADDGEIVGFRWNGDAELTENEFFEIKDWVEEYSEDNDDEDENDD